MRSKVFLGTLRKQNYLDLFRQGLEYIHFGDLGSGKLIFIKPNLTFPEYRPGVMTNPEAIEAAVIALKDYTDQIFIGDSDSGGYNRFSMDDVYSAIGIRQLTTQYGVKIVNLSQGPRRPIQFAYHGKEFSLPLPVLLLDDIDLTVTMPVPKVHCNTGVSLTFKNQWGCIPENKDRLRLHPYFQHVILEVNRAVKTRIALVDGKYGLNHNGPMLGDPVLLDWALVSDHIGTAARVVCRLMGTQIEKIPHLRYAETQNMIPKDEEIEINCDLAPFIGPRFYLRRKLTDYPGYLAFNSSWIAYLAYFSPLSGFLHKVLYLVRKPFYDYDRYAKH
jgi:uncharacterized protein (DUF362 family)